jgi:hypothetical protein
MAHASTLYTAGGLATFWDVSIETADSPLVIDQLNPTGVAGSLCLLVFGMSYNNLAHTLTFESWDGTTATETPPLEFDGSIGMLERYGTVIIMSKLSQAIRVKSSAQPVRYMFGISYDREFLRK